MKSVAISYTNFGPYHLARLRALAEALGRAGARLIAFETASTEGIYPWETPRENEPFEWVTLFSDRSLEDLPSAACSQAMSKALRRQRPDAVLAVGYSRPESMAMLAFARRTGTPSVLLSESQAIDHPRVWWKEAVKRRRIRRFSSAMVGGPRHHDYLVTLGMPSNRISFGNNAVDTHAYAADAFAARRDPDSRLGLPDRPFFMAVSRFATEKNLVGLVEAYARYRHSDTSRHPWDLVLCGTGPAAGEIEAAVAASGFARSIHRPGFLQSKGLARYYAHASAFVHPSLMEPWGLVVNEAAACGVPLLVSDRAGCAETFVPEGKATTGMRFDPRSVEAMSEALGWITSLSEAERRRLGGRAAEIARQWGPERFATGAIEAIQTAVIVETLRVKGRREESSVV